MDAVPEKRGRGRQRVPDEMRKKHRGISCTDAEWAELLKQAEAAGLPDQPSAYLIKKLKLTPKS
jgi:2-iminoacetate synthase ThiH